MNFFLAHLKWNSLFLTHKSESENDENEIWNQVAANVGRKNLNLSAFMSPSLQVYFFFFIAYLNLRTI